MPRAQIIQGRCERCVRDFRTPSPSQRFCSRSCAAKQPRPNRRRRIVDLKDCPCGTRFVASAPRVRFCSRTCVTKFGGQTRARICPHCSEGYETRAPIQVYCSVRCRHAARVARTVRRCELCGSEYRGVDSRRKFCTPACAYEDARRYRAAASPNWKGGRTLTSPKNGYVRVRCAGHPRTNPSNPYVLEHILIMEQQLGRYLAPNERIHHKNGRRDDNRPDNLELWKMKDPPGVRSSDYHCAGCNCDRQVNSQGAADLS